MVVIAAAALSLLVAGLASAGTGPPVQVSTGAHAARPQAGAVATAVTRSGAQLVVWSAASEEGGYYRLWGRVLGSDAAPVTEAFEISPPIAPEGQPVHALRAAVGVRGKREEFLVVWTQGPEADQLGEGNELVGRRVHARGRLLSAPFVIASAARWGRPDGADIVYGARGREFMVLWSGTIGDRGDEVYGARVPAGGTSASQAFRVSQTTAGEPGLPRAYAPAIAYEPRRGRYMAAWQARVPGFSRYEVFARTLPADPGGSRGSTRRISGFDAPFGASPRPELAYNRSTREYAVVWSAEKHEEAEIYARRLDVDGRARGPEVLVDNGSAFGAFNPDIVASTAGRYVVVLEQQVCPRGPSSSKHGGGTTAAPGPPIHVSSSSPASSSAISSFQGVDPRAAWAQEGSDSPADRAAYEVFARSLD